MSDYADLIRRLREWSERPEVKPASVWLLLKQAADALDALVKERDEEAKKFRINIAGDDVQRAVWWQKGSEEGYQRGLRDGERRGLEEAAKVVHKFGKAAAKELLETVEGSERQYAAKAMWSILGSAEDAIRALAGKTEE